MFESCCKLLVKSLQVQSGSRCVYMLGKSMKQNGYRVTTSIMHPISLARSGLRHHTRPDGH